MRMRPRSAARMPPQPFSAARAARTATSTSVLPPRATAAITSSVAGSISFEYSPPAGLTCWPSIKRSKCCIEPPYVRDRAPTQGGKVVATFQHRYDPVVRIPGRDSHQLPRHEFIVRLHQCEPAQSVVAVRIKARGNKHHLRFEFFERRHP